MASDDVATGGDDSLGYTLQELGQTMFDIKVRIAGDEKKIQSNRFAQEAFERQQTQWNKSMDDHMTRLIKADYVGRLATLRQTGSLEAYLTEFEPVLRKVSHVGDDTLTSLFITGLANSLKHELLIRRPASFSDAIALAQQLAACQAASNMGQSPRARSAWQPRDSRQPQRPSNPATKAAGATRHPSSQPRQLRESSGPTDYPIVRVSAAERADRTKRGLCWYCPEPYSRSHVCSKKFYALMGDDEESDSPRVEEDPGTDEEAENMVISGDVSRVLVIGPKLRPRSIRVTGTIYEAPVSVLIDGGSTHNFIKPAVAEKLSLSLRTISPFRVFVGNGASLRCDYVSLNTPIYLQGTCFDIDLFLLQVEGPDVILGVQWLQDLGKVLLDFRDLTMEFNWKESPVLLKGEDRHPKRISYNNLFSLIGQDRESEIFEIVALCPDSQDSRAPQTAVDPALSSEVRTDVQGKRIKEAQNINRSLSALADVITALANKSGHISYSLTLVSNFCNFLELKAHPFTPGSIRWLTPVIVSSTVAYALMYVIIGFLWIVPERRSSARAIGSNDVNEHSSHSHCKLCPVDLAGSDRLAKTDVQGKRIKEAQNINRNSMLTAGFIR
ncbi:hypothetical protein SASPL_143829 [Salvia splendens]|uniref:Kinesin motor domain-containing protein n=1 Tax=Salvia splendens TaxID=180675 RepID=A0A8X8WPE5_SALSN|nr:hypothetical protein SASPL_143829 [Salvia splendens]